MKSYVIFEDKEDGSVGVDIDLQNEGMNEDDHAASSAIFAGFILYLLENGKLDKYRDEYYQHLEDINS